MTLDQFELQRKSVQLFQITQKRLEDCDAAIKMLGKYTNGGTEIHFTRTDIKIVLTLDDAQWLSLALQDHLLEVMKELKLLQYTI